MARLAFRILPLLLAALSGIILSGCVSQEDDGKIGVVVTLPPQVEMIQAIGGDRIRTTLMVPPGESPHSYAPLPSQMTNVARARAYFILGSGVEFETNFLDEIKAQNRDLVIVNCSTGIAFRQPHDADSEHGSRDPHIWLSPTNAKQIVTNMCDALAAIDPGGRDSYEANRDDYIRRLEDLDRDIRDLLGGRVGSSFLVYHPAWGYFGDAYGLVEMAIEEAGKEPGPSGIAAMIQQAKSLGIRVVFVSPQFSRSSAETIAKEISGVVVTVDPLAGNYLENLRHVAGELAKGLSE